MSWAVILHTFRVQAGSFLGFEALGSGSMPLSFGRRDSSERLLATSSYMAASVNGGSFHREL